MANCYLSSCTRYPVATYWILLLLRSYSTTSSFLLDAIYAFPYISFVLPSPCFFFHFSSDDGCGRTGDLSGGNDDEVVIRVTFVNRHPFSYVETSLVTLKKRHLRRYVALALVVAGKEEILDKLAWVPLSTAMKPVFLTSRNSGCSSNAITIQEWHCHKNYQKYYIKTIIYK